MEIIFELLFQLVFEVVGEFLVEAGYRGAAAVLRSVIGRYIVAALIGLGGGLWWGIRLSTRGNLDEPRALWVSLALAGAAAIIAGYLVLTRPDATLEPGEHDHDILSWPWHWPAYRFAGFALLNLAIALGIAIGFQPLTTSIG